jgi:hypothetical protein
VKEKGQGRPGAPRNNLEDASPKEQGLGQRESKERQPLPSVWDVLERRAKLWSLETRFRMNPTERETEKRKLKQKEQLIGKKGTARDKLILEVVTNITFSPIEGGGTTYTFPSPEKLQQLRSQVDPLSEEELAKEVRKQREEIERMRKLPPLPILVYGQPHLPDYLFDDEED